MIQIFKDDINKDEWDKFVENHQGQIFNYSFYLDICSENWFILRDELFENAVAIPVISKVGVQKLYRPIFWREAQIFGDSESFKKDVIEYLYKNYKFAFIAFDFNYKKYSPKLLMNQIVSERSFQGNKLANRMVKKAVSSSLQVEITTDFTDVFKIITSELSEKISELTDEAFLILENLIRTLQFIDKLKVFNVLKEGKVVGGLLCIQTRNKLIYLKGASVKSARENGSMYLAMKTTIEYAISKDLEFDFGGSNVDGVKRFNLNLGGKDKFYYLYEWNNTPIWFNILKKIYHLWKRK